MHWVLRRRCSPRPDTPGPRSPQCPPQRRRQRLDGRRPKTERRTGHPSQRRSTQPLTRHRRSSDCRNNKIALPYVIHKVDVMR